MDWNESTRRSFLKQFGAAGALALAAAKSEGLGAQSPATPAPQHARRPEAGIHARRAYEVVA